MVNFSLIRDLVIVETTVIADVSNYSEDYHVCVGIFGHVYDGQRVAIQNTLISYVSYNVKASYEQLGASLLFCNIGSAAILLRDVAIQGPGGRISNLQGKVWNAALLATNI